jgi:hypothetical protein
MISLELRANAISKHEGGAQQQRLLCRQLLDGLSGAQYVWCALMLTNSTALPVYLLVALVTCTASCCSRSSLHPLACSSPPPLSGADW